MIYEEKFGGLIAAIKKAQTEKAEFIIIPSPETLGDDYAELVESLKRIAAAGLASRMPPPSRSSESRSSLN